MNIPHPGLNAQRQYAQWLAEKNMLAQQGMVNSVPWGTYSGPSFGSQLVVGYRQSDLDCWNGTSNGKMRTPKTIRAELQEAVDSWLEGI